MEAPAMVADAACLGLARTADKDTLPYDFCIICRLYAHAEATPPLLYQQFFRKLPRFADFSSSSISRVIQHAITPGQAPKARALFTRPGRGCR